MVYSPPASAAHYEFVEHQLRTCPAVRDALVLRRADRPDGRDLVAYLLAEPGAAISPSAIREYVGHALAPRLLPSTFITLDAFPRSPDGCIELSALPAPDSAELGLRQYEVPLGPVERMLAALWADLLGIDEIGRQAHFFELGGHSMLALQLVHRLRTELEIDIAMRELFLAPVLRDFAAAVSGHIRLPGAPQSPSGSAALTARAAVPLAVAAPAYCRH